jgi:carboxymethylenebutenolidase
VGTLPDLGAIFDEHVASEFVAKDVDATMRTMTAEPYVWHVPALSGVAGAEAVRAFYSSQFIDRHPGRRGPSPDLADGIAGTRDR